MPKRDAWRRLIYRSTANVRLDVIIIFFFFYNYFKLKFKSLFIHFICSKFKTAVKALNKGKLYKIPSYLVFTFEIYIFIENFEKLYEVTINLF